MAISERNKSASLDSPSARAADGIEAVVADAQDLVGRVIVPRTTVVVDRSAVTALAKAVDDRNPLWLGGVEGEVPRAMPTFVYHLVPRSFDVTRDERPRPLIELPLGSPVNGGIEYEFSRPVRVGDELHVETRVHSVTLREARNGRIVVFVAETVVDAADGEVARYRHTTLYRRPKQPEPEAVRDDA